MLPPLPQMKMPALPMLKPKRPSNVATGEGFVQVLLDAPDDVGVRLMMAAEGVRFADGSLLPLTGTLFITVAPGGKMRYCWRT